MSMSDRHIVRRVSCISTGDAAPHNRRDGSMVALASRCQPKTKINLIVRDVDRIATEERVDLEYKLLKMKFTIYKFVPISAKRKFEARSKLVSDGEELFGGGMKPDAATTSSK